MSSTRRHAAYRSFKRFMIRTAPPMELLAIVLSGVNLTLAVLFLLGFFDC